MSSISKIPYPPSSDLRKFGGGSAIATVQGMAFLALIFFASVFISPSAASAASCAARLNGEKSISIIDSDTGEPITLPAVSRAQIRKRLQEIRNISFRFDGQLYQVPWAYIDGNHCKERATLTALALATGRTKFDGRISRAMEDQFVKHPQIASAYIRIYDNISFERILNSPDGRQSVRSSISWYTHVGVLVNVDGSPQIIDLSISDEPMPLKAWIRRYSKRSMSILNGEEADSLGLFLQKVGDGIPKKMAGYVFASRVPAEGLFPPPGGWLRYSLDVFAQLSGDWTRLSNIFPDVPVNQMQNVQVKIRVN